MVGGRWPRRPRHPGPGLRLVRPLNLHGLSELRNGGGNAQGGTKYDIRYRSRTFDKLLLYSREVIAVRRLVAVDPGSGHRALVARDEIWSQQKTGASTFEWVFEPRQKILTSLKVGTANHFGE